MNINDLPFELLLHIFVTGCDEPDYPREADDFDWSDDRYAFLHLHPRRPKTFAALLRRVCASWRNIIEAPGKTGSQFHVVRVGMEWDWLNQSSIQGLLRQFSKTKKFLASSNGCDVIAHFECLTTRDDVGELSPKEEKIVRIFIHGMYTIVPFQRQLISLELDSAQPQICKHFSEILMGFESTSRLSKLIFHSFTRTTTSRVRSRCQPLRGERD